MSSAVGVRAWVGWFGGLGRELRRGPEAVRLRLLSMVMAEFFGWSVFACRREGRLVL